MLFASLALVFAGVTTVHAHGYVQTVNIAGQTYQGWHPFTDPYATPPPTTVVRKVANDGPITFNSADLTCNTGGNTGNGVTATVAAGQTVTWTMNTWPSDHKGPVTVYMANCGDNCDSFDGTGNVWFKLSSDGLLNAGSFYWASDKLIANGKSWTATIPANIQAGKYLMRLELLALHSAGAPQFYPSCTQLDITGGGNGAPATSELVSIPGVYQQGDPALFGNIWNQPQSWPQVGPNVAAFVSGNANPAPASSSSLSSAAVAPSSGTMSTTSNSPPTTTLATSSTYSEAEPTAVSSTKSAEPGPATKGSSSNKICRIKNKNKHLVRREYMRRLMGKKRL